MIPKNVTVYGKHGFRRLHQRVWKKIVAVAAATATTTTKTLIEHPTDE